MVTIGRRGYDLMYRFGAPWEGADRVELRALIRDGRCAPATLRRAGATAVRAVDLGCGSGAVSLELAEAGFEVTGIDFSPIARRKAMAEAARRGFGRERVRFVGGDLTAGRIDGVEGPFDLLVDYGTLDDLPDAGRSRMAAYVAGLARPGARLFLFAFVGRPEDLPRMSFGGPSRAFPGLVPGEVERLFEPAFDVTPLQVPTRGAPFGTWLLERTEAPALHVQAPLVAVGSIALDPPSTLARIAGPLLIVGSILSAIGIAFFIAMYASFAVSATSAGMSFGFVNDVLGLMVCALTMPAVLALHELIGFGGRWRDRAIRALGLGSLGAIAILQWLLVTGGLSFEQQIGPVALAYLALGAWFILTGRAAARRGILANGTRLGVLAATYFGYPVWAYRLGRQFSGRSMGRRPATT